MHKRALQCGPGYKHRDEKPKAGAEDVECGSPQPPHAHAAVSRGTWPGGGAMLQRAEKRAANTRGIKHGPLTVREICPFCSCPQTTKQWATLGRGGQLLQGPYPRTIKAVPCPQVGTGQRDG